MAKKSEKKKKVAGFASVTSRDILPGNKSVNPHSSPIYTSSTYLYESVEKAQSVFSGEAQAFIYSRWSHPNAEMVESKLEELETFGTDVKCKALCFSSGMSALAALYQSLLKPGDNVLVQGNVYGTAVDYFNVYGKQFGVNTVFLDPADTNQLEAELNKKQVRLFYLETPSNPTLSCFDLSKLTKLAHKYGAVVCVDNTFATPYLQQPFRFGVDFVLYSSTKYLNGHGTGLSGFILGTDTTFVGQKLWQTRKLNGSICAPFDAWLLNLGLKTLSLRMDKHNANALIIAKWLEKHKAVSKVYYLGLKSHPDHKIAKKQMTGFGGVLSFELNKGYKAGVKLMNSLKFCQLTASLGTIDTLIQHPAGMSHSFVPKAQREKFGITDGLVRLSVGIEDVNDIIEDLEQALAKC